MTHTLGVLILWIPLMHGDQIRYQEWGYASREVCEIAALDFQRQRGILVLFSRCYPPHPKVGEIGK